MLTEPLKFPNLVTGLDKNACHAERAALYTRYTPFEWSQDNLRHYSDADNNKNYSERLRGDFLRVMRQTDERTLQMQRESNRRLGERITNITFWRNEVRCELDRMITEIGLLLSGKKALQKVIEDVEGPLNVAQECLYHREKRQGIDLVHDSPEEALIKEVETYKNCQIRLKNLFNKVMDQLKNNRAAQHELEMDVKSKESALGIDNLCHQLNNYSRGINFYAGIEKMDPTLTTVETWAENSNRIVQRSQAERGKSAQLRSDIDNLINCVCSEIWTVWSATNSALERRSSEILETRNKLQMHLHKVQQEIFDLEKYIDLLRKAILDKSNPLKVAHTRLEARSHRREVELCKDDAHNILVKEVYDLQDCVDSLHKKLREAEIQLQQLLKTKANLETDLHIKSNSLFIDREKCMGMRKAFPITATVKM